MIFKLVESKQVGTIYRIFNAKGMKEILDKDTCSSEYYSNISFTRDKNMTNFWGMYPRSIFQIVVDGDELSNVYKISPVADSVDDYVNGKVKKLYRSNEHEERVNTRHIKNISKYIKYVRIILDNIDEDTITGLLTTPIEELDNRKFTNPYTVKDIREMIRECDKRFGIKVIYQGKEVGIEELEDLKLI